MNISKRSVSAGNRAAMFRAVVLLTILGLGCYGQQKQSPPVTSASRPNVATKATAPRSLDQGYTLRVIARDGDVIEGRTIQSFTPDTTAGPFSGVPQSNSAMINDAGQMAFGAVTDKGPVIVMDGKIAAFGGMRIGDITAESFGRPAINNRGSIAYLVRYSPAGAPHKQAIVLNGKIVLTSDESVSQKCAGAFVNPLLNGNDAYAVDNFGGQCLFIDGAVRLRQLATIGDATIGTITPGMSFTNEGEYAFSSIASGNAQHRSAYHYICTLQHCDDLPQGAVQLGPLLNNSGQMVYSVIGAMLRRGDHSELPIARSLNFAFNDKGQIATGNFEMIRYDTPRDTVYTPEYSERIKLFSLTQTAQLKTILGAGKHVTGFDVRDHPSINNHGQIVFHIDFQSCDLVNGFPSNCSFHEAIILANPKP